MGIKEIAGRMLSSFFVIFSGSVLAMYAFNLIFGDDTIPLHNITALLVMTVLGSLAFFIFYSRKELGRRQMFIRFGVHLLAIIGIMLSVAFYVEWVVLGEPVTVAVFVGLVAAVYVMVTAIEVYRSKKLADKLTMKLRERYKG